MSLKVFSETAVVKEKDHYLKLYMDKNGVIKVDLVNENGAWIHHLFHITSRGITRIGLGLTDEELPFDTVDVGCGRKLIKTS